MAAINAFRTGAKIHFSEKNILGYGHFKIFGFTQATKRGKVIFFCSPTRMEAKEKATSPSHLWLPTELRLVRTLKLSIP